MTFSNEVRLSTIQKEIHAWSTKNFGKRVDLYFDVSSFLGIVEELGELAHSILKLSQGIRGSKVEHLAKVKDAIGDMMVYLLDFAERNSEQLDGVDVDQMLAEVWDQVRRRDWRKNHSTGFDPEAAIAQAMQPNPYPYTKESRSVEQGAVPLASDEPSAS